MIVTYEDVQRYSDEYNPSDKVLRPKDYQDALDVQNACNLSAVIFSFNELMQKICDEAHQRERGTIWKNKHPICILYCCVISNLTTGDLIDTTYYAEAYKICQQKADN